MQCSISVIRLSRTAFLHNLDVLRNLAPRSRLCPVVKANAYGHGLKAILDILVNQKIEWLGVHSLEEAVHLRGAAYVGNILILGYVEREECTEAIEQQCSLGVCNLETLKTLAALGKPCRVHLKLETGTHRQGIDLMDLEKILEFFREHPNLILEGAYTHFANIEDTTDSSFAMSQLECFKQMVAMIRQRCSSPLILHTACSAAHILFPETHFDLVRPGISLYGYWSSRETWVTFKERNRKPPELKPVLSWHTHVGQVKSVPEGGAVGYGCTYRAPRAMRIAVLPVGYYDGYVRALAPRAHVLIRGRRAGLVGRICMNMTMVDVTNIPHVQLEDEVTLIGRQGQDVITASDMADWSGTIHYEVLARLNHIIRREVAE